VYNEEAAQVMIGDESDRLSFLQQPPHSSFRADQHINIGRTPECFQPVQQSNLKHSSEIILQ
jgi:hypothetical protein